MLRYYLRDGTRIKLGPDGQQPASVDPTFPLVWLDLFNPSPEEDRRVEQLVGVSIPSREEMEEIEVSARLYQEDGAEFMTITAVIQLDTEEPATTPITFVLKGATLVTVRYAEPTAFSVFVARAQKPNAVPCANGEQIMMGLIEALFDRMADALERVGIDMDAISRAIFRKKSSAKSAKTTRDLQVIIEKIGQDGDLLTMVRESLVSINRALTYHTSVEQEDKKVTKEARARNKVLYRDVVALTDQATFLSNKINLLLDATLGLINLERQNGWPSQANRGPKKQGRSLGHRQEIKQVKGALKDLYASLTEEQKKEADNLVLPMMGMGPGMGMGMGPGVMGWER